MNRTDVRRLELAGSALHAAVTVTKAEGIVAGPGTYEVRITPRHGEPLTTRDYEEALAHISGGADHNRRIDSVSGRPAQIVAAEDTATNTIICRLCHLDRADRMTPRFNLLDDQKLRRLMKQTGIERCSTCGRIL